MVALWSYLIFLVVLTIVVLLVSYTAAAGVVGREVVIRNLRYSIPLIVAMFMLGFVGLPLLRNYTWIMKYGWTSFQILYAVGIIAWLLSWLFRKKKAGALLIDIGRTPQNKLIFWIGLIEVAFVVLQTWVSFRLILNSSSNYIAWLSVLSRIAFWWSFAGCFVALGLSRLQFRENSISFMYSLIWWTKIKSYTWEQSKPNTLTLRFKSHFPLLPGFTSIVIPPKYKDAVNQILNEKLQHQL